MGRLLAVLRSLDWMLLALTVLLVAFGLAVLYSLTLNVDKPDLRPFQEQALFAVVGFAALFAVSCIDYRFFRSYGWVVFGIGAVLLLTVLVFGTEIRSARSWFTLGPWTVQPVELAKICLIVFFAKYFTDRSRDVFGMRHLVVAGAGAGLYLILVLLQPDLGSAMILLALFVALALLVNVQRAHLVLLTGVFVLGAVASWFLLLRPYQKERIRNVFNPGRDPLKLGYNVKQATVAIGAGRLFGRGLGLGTQSQLNFLPEQKTDFIFAVIAEELGFLGASVLLLLYAVLLYRLYALARRCRDEFGVYLIFGIFTMLFVQSAMNIGMNIGLLPVAGLPLPFLSAGGSSLITALVAIGMVQSVYIRHGRFGATSRTSER